MLKISLSQTALAQPPYTPVFDLAAGFAGLKEFFAALSLENYALIASDAIYLVSYLKSLEIAVDFDGHPAADRLPARLRHGARARGAGRRVLFMLVVLPFWTSFLIRIYAWINILQRDGLLNQALLALGIVDAPLTWLATDTAVYIGIVYSYLPFMVLPIYATLEKMDETLLEAAADLGCPRWKAFWLVTLPLSLPGRRRGRAALLHPDRRRVRHPRSARRLRRRAMIGQTLWTEFFANRDWPVASAVAVVLLACWWCRS